MHFQQFYLACLSHASYLIASEGEAAVVDPQRDIGIYLDEAAAHGFQIKHVIETHLHADFVSGHRELAERTGARIYLGAQSGAQFPHVAIHDGDELTMGRVWFRFLATPGHTLESISIVVTDLDRSPDPYLVFTGDTLFIGDVGRPDLSPDHTPQQLAAMLHDSLHNKLLKLSDDVLVYPAHGAGSLCGRALSNDRSSSIGIQRATNYALRATSKEQFVDLLTSELPQRPGYFAQDVEINRSGAPALTELKPLAAQSPAATAHKQQNGAIVVDTRPPMQYAVAHIPESIQIGLSGQFASWAGIVLGLDKDLVIVAEDDEHAQESRLRLARVGIERVAGFLEGGISAWIKEGRPVVYTPQIAVDELRKQLAEDPGHLQVIDVRKPGEYEQGHVPGAVLRPVDRLSNLAGLDPARPSAVYCKSGYRSTIASSLLERAGFQQVINVTGGYDAWQLL